MEKHFDSKKREKGAIKNKMGLKRKMKKEKRIWKFYGENLRPKDLNNLKKIKTQIEQFTKYLRQTLIFM